jgi:hypothetical protein
VRQGTDRLVQPGGKKHPFSIRLDWAIMRPYAQTTLELGTTAEAGVCAGYGALPVLSAGDATDYRGHDTRRGHPEDPPASETGSRPAPDRSGACPPGRLCLVLRLTAPSGSLNRPRQPSSGPEPEVTPCAAREWGGKAVLRPACTPSASRGSHGGVPLAFGACSTPTRVCTRLSLVHAVPACAPVSPRPLRCASSVARTFVSGLQQA